jgi:hypothetical protein
MTMQVRGGWTSAKFTYKGIIFTINRADDGSGWYFSSAMLADRTIVEPTGNAGLAGGDTHYCRKKDIIEIIKRAADNGVYKIRHGEFYRLPQPKQ